MKLPELKNRFKNKYVIRIIAGALVVAMIGTGVSVSSVEAAKTTKTTESTQSVAKDDTEETEEEKDAKNVLSDALDDSIKFSEKEIGKEETVYVISDSTGKPQKTIVSDHLINSDKKAALTDASTLTDIENVKGDETFTQNGEKLTWQADGNDIYYQGTTNEKAPVSQKITYYLDGKEITPEELAGKSGEVTIHFDYTNNEKTETTIDGKKTEIYVPFLAISGMILDDSFSNVKVTNGKLVSDGTKNVVIGYTLPGLKDSLNVKDSDFDGDVTIPEYFEVTADVENFSLDMTMTAIVNATNFVNTEEGDLSSMDDLLDTLTDATEQLKDGSSELADGTSTLKSKMGEFSDGVGTLKTGVKDYTDGASTLAGGIGTLKSGVDTLVGSVPELVSGVGKLKDGADSAAKGGSTLKTGAGSLKTGAKDLSAGAKTLKTGASDLSTGANTLLDGTKTLSTGAKDLQTGAKDLSAGVQSIATGAKDLSTGADTLAAGASSLNSGVDTLLAKLTGMATDLATQKAGLYTEFSNSAGMSYEDAQAMIGNLTKLQSALADGIKAGVLGDAATEQATYATVAAQLGKDGQITNAAQAAGAMAALTDTITKLQSGISTVDGAARVIDTVAGQLQNEETTNQLTVLKQGASDLATGASNLAAGVSTLSQGADSAATGAATLAAGTDSLVTGADSLVTGAGSLATGAGSLATGASDLATGAGKVYDGASQVSDGAATLSTGLNTLDEGISTLHKKTGTLSSGATELKNGTDELASGASELVSNNTKLNNGVSELSDGTNAIVDGVGKLDDGAHELADGIVEFNEEGIEKIVNSYNGDIEPLIDRIQGVLDAGEDYQSFTAVADGVNGSVKFIVKTDAIKAED